MIWQTFDNLSVRVATPAKLNLFLEIQSRRDDGFHNLDTVMANFALYDCMDLSADDSQDISLEVSGSCNDLVAGVPSDETNIVVKALHLSLIHI